MKKLLQATAVVAFGAFIVGCSNNAQVEAKADEALRTAQEAKSIAQNTQAQFDKYFKPSRYK